MGLESNISGDCDISFSTLKKIKLVHTVSNNTLTEYKVVYQNTDFGMASNPTFTIPCNTTPTSLEITPTQLVLGNLFDDVLIEACIYWMWFQ